MVPQMDIKNDIGKNLGPGSEVLGFKVQGLEFRV